MIKKSNKKSNSHIPYDSTYGNEPDLLDKPGVIVEPVVRKKVAAYLKKMFLREIIQLIIEADATGVQPASS